MKRRGQTERSFIWLDGRKCEVFPDAPPCRHFALRWPRLALWLSLFALVVLALLALALAVTLTAVVAHWIRG